MLEVYLIRHAECEMNLKPDIIAGRSNSSPLTITGKMQAMCLGKRFESECVTFTKVYSSPALRAKDTALLSLLDPHMTIDDRLQEMDRGSWEGQTRSKMFTADYRERLDVDNWHTGAPDGESPGQVGLRGYSFLQEVIEPHKRGLFALYAHGGLIRFTLREIMQFDANIAWMIPIENTSITHIAYIKSRWVPIRINDYAHLSLMNESVKKEGIAVAT